MTQNDLYYLAGIVSTRRATLRSDRDIPVLQIAMPDRDVMERIANAFRRPVRERAGQFVVMVTGADAIGWLLTLYALLGARRRDEIRAIIARWRAA